MPLTVVTLGSWFGHIIICYYLIRSIPNTLIRVIFTLLPCVILSYKSCLDLLQYDAYSLIIVASCWLTSIRLIDMIILTRENVLTFQQFLLKIVWIYFPILPLKSKRNEWPLKFYFLLIVFKLLVNHWLYRWSLTCQPKINYEKIFLFYMSMITISYMYDMVIVFIRILTRDQYTFESFTNFPIFSLSLREFWGLRYNRIIGTVLKESVFEPMCRKFSSRTIGALTTFIVSGCFHVHMAFVTFDDVGYLFPAFMFFVLHGVACGFEVRMKMKLSAHVRWLLTHAFLLLTAPLLLEPFVKKGSPFLVVHPPPLIHYEWLPQLPAINLCL